MSEKQEASVGRPSSFTEERVRKLEEAFMFDATVTEACAFADISRQSYYEECKRTPEFADKMERAQQFVFMLAKKTVVQALNKEDGNLAMKWLKNRQSDRYHEKVEQEVKDLRDPVKDLADALRMDAEPEPSTTAAHTQPDSQSV